MYPFQMRNCLTRLLVPCERLGAVEHLRTAEQRRERAHGRERLFVGTRRTQDALGIQPVLGVDIGAHLLCPGIAQTASRQDSLHIADMPDFHDAVFQPDFPHAVHGKGDGLRVREGALLAEALNTRLDDLAALDAARVLRVPLVEEIGKAHVRIGQLGRGNAGDGERRVRTQHEELAVLVGELEHALLRQRIGNACIGIIIFNGGGNHRLVAARLKGPGKPLTHFA